MEQDMREIRSAYEQNKETVVNLLLENIMKVTLIVPKVVIGDFE